MNQGELRALLNPSLLKSHRILTGILESVYDSKLANGNRILAHLGELQYLKKNTDEAAQQQVNHIYTDVQDRLAWATRINNPLTPQERAAIIEACNELRLHMIASALSIGGSTPNQRSQRTALLAALQEDDADSEHFSPIVHGRGGVLHARVGSSRVIILPRIKSDEQCHEIYDELLVLFDRSGKTEHWIVDLSLIEELPMLLLANLIAYAGKLRAEFFDIHLCWVREDLAGGEQLERLKEFFKLKSVGGYYFSSQAS